MELKLRAYAPKREPQLGICEVRRIDFEFGNVTISNGQVTTVLDLNEVIFLPRIGPTDKNGQEIFEGDTVKFDTGLGRPLIGKVTWDSEKAQYVVVVNRRPERQEIWDVSSIVALNCTIEVISDIHESPEMLGSLK